MAAEYWPVGYWPAGYWGGGYWPSAKAAEGPAVVADTGEMSVRRGALMYGTKRRKITERDLRRLGPKIAGRHLFDKQDEEDVLL